MKALVLSSGGIDSTTCLAMAVEKYGADNVIGLCMYYGQKHQKEIESAKKVANYYGTELYELNLSKIFAYSKCTLLNQSEDEIPHESYDEQLKHIKYISITLLVFHFEISGKDNNDEQFLNIWLIIVIL